MQSVLISTSGYYIKQKYKHVNINGNVFSNLLTVILETFSRIPLVLF